MKNNVKNLGVFFFASLFFLMGCNHHNEITPVQKTDLYVYLDYTEGENYHSIENDLDNYLDLMNISDESPRNHGSIKIFPLYDIGSTPNSKVKIKEGKGKMEGNKYLRQQEVDRFKTNIMEKVEEMNAEYSNKKLKKSHIFQPLSKGFSKLEKSSANRKIVIIYSDMLENSDLANFHKKMDTQKLTESFDKVWNSEDISDFEVFIVHPISKKDDALIQKSGNFWKNYLGNKGLDQDMYHFDTSIEL